jgi:hypothetical protein
MKNLIRYLSLLSMTIVLLSMRLVAGGAAFPAPAVPTFNAQVDMTHRDGIETRQPRVVLLGDSMVEENVDLAALSDALGTDVYRISYPGSSSALWYLSLKNNIINAATPPQVVVIHFRDSVLTTPQYRVGGKFNAALDVLAGADETVLLQLAFSNYMNPLESSARRILPVYASGTRIRNELETRIGNLTPRALLGCGDRCVDKASLSVFNFRTIAPPAANDPVAQEEAVLYSSRALDFSAQVGRSFLPEIIRLCREHGIQLIFVRGKTISFADLSEPRGLDDYILDLQEYLTKNGASFADLQPDARLRTEDYIDRFHIQPEARETYTQMLTEALIPLLR